MTDYKTWYFKMKAEKEQLTKDLAIADKALELACEEKARDNLMRMTQSCPINPCLADQYVDMEKERFVKHHKEKAKGDE